MTLLLEKTVAAWTWWMSVGLAVQPSGRHQPLSNGSATHQSIPVFPSNLLFRGYLEWIL